MPGNDAIRIGAVVEKVMPAGRFRVVLENGHRLIARVLRRRADEFAAVRVGDELQVRLSPGDMSQGTVEQILKTNT